MNKITKKVMIYSLAGLLQLGLGAAVTHAAPAPEAAPWQQQDNEKQHQQPHNDNRPNEDGHNKHNQHPQPDGEEPQPPADAQPWRG